MYKSRQRIRYFVKTLFGKIPPNCMLHAADFASMPAKALPITPLSHCEPRSTEGLPVMLLIRRQMSDSECIRSRFVHVSSQNYCQGRPHSCDRQVI